MKLTEAIKQNPYLKPSNCTDVADVEYAMDELRKLDAQYGDNNKTLLRLWTIFLQKKNQFNQ